MEGVPTAAFVQSEHRLEIVVNFGVLAGRDVSRDEVNTLADVLLRIVGSATVFTGRRYEFATGAADVAGSEVRIWFPPHALPKDVAERDALLERVLAEVDRWARVSAARAPAEGEDLVSRIIRGPTDRQAPFADQVLVGIGETVELPDGRAVAVVEVYDDEIGREGDLRATLVVDET